MRAETARQKQAEVALHLARGVLVEIESLAVARRSRELDDASARFCNLVALTLFHCAGDMATAFERELKDGVDQLRGRLLDMGTNMLVDKVRKVHERAAAVLTGGAYPLGLADTLGISLAGILDNLKLLGAWDHLSEEDRALVDETRERVVELADFERRYGLTLCETAKLH